ncbi:unnamed protein product [Linum tenue]|uniref:Uncharacterized protein n=1 Tax=Linum tenue TaxID=586396 RepID=A0AAV0IJ19_9ROSI|nr:unnamed protein product [Linum tenue]
MEKHIGQQNMPSYFPFMHSFHRPSQIFLAFLSLHPPVAKPTKYKPNSYFSSLDRLITLTMNIFSAE